MDSAAEAVPMRPSRFQLAQDCLEKEIVRVEQLSHGLKVADINPLLNIPDLISAASFGQTTSPTCEKKVNCGRLQTPRG